jgi:hypothetical protein
MSGVRKQLLTCDTQSPPTLSGLKKGAIDNKQSVALAPVGYVELMKMCCRELVRNALPRFVMMHDTTNPDE